MKRRNVACLVLAAVCTAAVGARAQSPAYEKAQGSKAVIELFTSQGCSSCPPADALLHTLAARKDLIALTLPVDYWDYLGWKDTFASPRFSERQKAYAKTRGDGMIYTPQAVVNGAVHVNGASQPEIEQAIGKTEAKLKTAQIPVTLTSDQGKLVISLGARGGDGSIGEATIWLAAVQRHGEVAIVKGENSGRKLTYTNVVRDLMPVGMWSGKAETIRLDRQSVERPGADTYAVLVQTGSTGPITGAAWLSQ